LQQRTLRALYLAIPLFAGSLLLADAKDSRYNVRDFGATGKKADNAQAAIQKAVDTCAAAGGVTVLIPAGEYTSGTIRLRSHVRIYLESGATLFASKNGADFYLGAKKDRAAVFYGEDVDNITIEGRGTVDGQAEYLWRIMDFDDAYIRPNMLLMKSLGKPLMRSFPGGFPTETVFPRMILLIRCKDVRIAGLSFIRSRSWNINPYACERLVIDGVYIHSSLKEAVWADGIDPDGCKDVHISNSTIETGDDAIVFYSSDSWGPALPCENITVTNCRISSASSAVKFCDGNQNCIRKVTIDNSTITASNRGIAFMTFNEGYVSDVVISNMTIETVRHDWFWWGDGDPIHFNILRRGEIDNKTDANAKIGAIRNVIVRNVVARGMGTSGINGHPDSWLENVSLENVKLFMSHDPASPLETAEQAMKIRWAKNLKLRDVEVFWDQPASGKWKNALSVQDVKQLELNGFSARQAKLGSDDPTVIFRRVEDAVVRNSRAAEGTGTFLRVSDGSSKIYLLGNDFRATQFPVRADPAIPVEQIKMMNNFPATLDK
jgi:polygalacturonase